MKHNLTRADIKSLYKMDFLTLEEAQKLLVEIKRKKAQSKKR